MTEKNKKNNRVTFLLLALLLIIIAIFINANVNKVYGYDKSVYYDYVNFVEESTVSEDNPHKEYIVLRSRGIEEEVSIDGWSIVRLADRSLFPISKVYYGSILNREGSESGIKLLGDNTIIINSGRSPVGSAFAVNSCTGYVQQVFTFFPSIKEECISPFDLAVDLGVVLTPTCNDYVKQLPVCRVLTSTNSANFSGVDFECSSFIEKTLNEDVCVLNESKKKTFLTGEYRVFLNQEKGVWKEGDVAILLDAEGMIVSSFEY